MNTTLELIASGTLIFMCLLFLAWALWRIFFYHKEDIKNKVGEYNDK